MDKIDKIVIENLIERIEKLENIYNNVNLQSCKELQPKETKSNNNAPSDRQIQFMIDLGIEIPSGLTKDTAKEIISNAVKKRNEEVYKKVENDKMPFNTELIDKSQLPDY